MPTSQPRRIGPALPLLLLILTAPALLPGRALAQSGACQVGARVTDRQNRSGVVVEAKNSDCWVTLDDGTKHYYLAWMLKPAGAAGEANSGSSKTLERGTYRCWAAGGTAGTLRLVVRSSTRYADRNGQAGTYAFDPSTQQITFTSGPWAGYYGKLLAPGKIGLSSRPGAYYGTVCDLEE